MNEKLCILFQISLKIIPKGPTNNKWALVQVMAVTYLAPGVGATYAILG